MAGSLTKPSTAAPTVSYAFTPPGWDANYRAALGLSGSAIVPILSLGDSVLQGSSSTANARTSFWLKLMDALQTRYGTAGTGFHFHMDSTNGAGGAPFIDNTAATWVFTGSWTTNNFGIGGQSYTNSANGAGNYATATVNGTSVDLWFSRVSNGGTFTITIDGTPYDKNGVANGAGGNPTCLNATFQQFKITCSGLAAGAHTIVLTSVGKICLHGVTCYSAAAGILPMRVAWQGKSAYDFASPTGNDNVKNMVEQFTPLAKLVLLEHGINDLQTNVNAAEYETYIRRMVESAKVAGASVLFLTMNLGPMFSWTNGTNGERYINAQYKVANSYNCGLLNLNAAWADTGTGTIASHYLGHPDDFGHNDIATRLFSLLG